MKSLGFGSYALTIGTASALLAGCGGSQLPIGAPGATQISAIATRAAHGKSWMLPGSSGGDLLYVVNEYATYVSVYSYPGGALVGTLSNPDYANGDCSDKAGNVFIVNLSTASSGGGDVVEYAHGGTTPIKTLSYPNAYLNGCSVDPTTGNLAVTDYRPTNGHRGKGGVLIYPNASGTATEYFDPGMTDYSYCAYDNAGNLYVDGFSVPSGYFQLAELPKGKKIFTNIKLSKRLENELSVGGVQWDGTDVVIGIGRAVVGDHIHIQVYRISVTGSTGKLVGTTWLKRAHSQRDFQFWIQGSTIISGFGSLNRGGQQEKLGFWTYPHAQLTKVVRDQEGGPWGATVSLAPSD